MRASRRSSDTSAESISPQWCFYGYDKRAAVQHRLRVPESVLHVVALLGGSPAALISQRMFRHKTVKTSFRVSFWLIVFVQVALIAAAIWWRRHPPAWLPDALR